MNLAPGRLFGDQLLEERDELGAGVALCGFSEYLASLRIERGEQRQGTVALVFETVSLRTSGRERKQGISAIKGLDSRFLTHTEDGRVLWRIHIKADDVGRLGLEIGIVRGHVALDAMRLKTVFAPRAGHSHVMEPELLGEFPDAPVGRSGGGSLLSPGQDPRFNLGSEPIGDPSGVPTVESGEPLGEKPLLPLADERRGTSDAFLDCGIGHTLIKEEQNPCDPSIVSPPAAAPCPRLQFFFFDVTENHDVVRHGRNDATKCSNVTFH